MADELGSGQVAIKPTFVGFRGQVTSEVEASGSEGGRKFSTAFGSAVKGIGSIVGKSLLAGGAIVGAIGALSIKGGISKALQIEDATAKMKGLGNSTETVSEVMANALSAVKGTAFGMGDAANVASTALASGIKPGEQMSKYLTLVADAASTAQVPLGEMGQIMGKVTNSGKVTNDVLNQFGDRGVGVLQMLAKEYGVTSEEMTNMVSKGKVDADTFNRVLTENLGGAAKRSGDTTRGAFANMKSAMANFGMALVGGFLPLVKPAFNQVQKIFEGLTDRLKPFAAEWSATFQSKAGPVIAGFADKVLANVDKVLGAAKLLWAGLTMDAATRAQFAGDLDGFVAFGAGVRTVFDELRGGFIAFGSAWRENNGDITSSGFPGFMEQAAFAIRQVVDGFKLLDFSSVGGFFASIGPAVGQAGSAFDSIGSSLSALAPAFAAFGEQLPKIAGAAAQLAGVGLNVLTGALSFLADNVNTIIAFMPVIVAGFVAWRIASAAMGASMFSLQAAQAAMAPVNLANNIIRVQAIRLEMQHAAATGANTAAQNTGMFATVRSTAAMVGQKIAMAAGAVATGVATAAQWAWNAALSANPISLIIIAIAALVAGLVFFFTQTQLGQEVFANVFGFIQALAASVAAWFTGTFLPALIGAWQGVQQSLAALGAFFTALWNGILAFIGAVLNNILSGVGAFISNALRLFFAFSPLGILSGNFGQVISYLAGVWPNILNGISGFISNALRFFSNLPSQIVSTLGNLGGLLLGAGQALIQGFINGIKGMVGAIGDAVGGVLDFAKQFFPHSPAKRGPFSGRGYTSFSGQALAEDFAGGMDSRSRLVAGSAERLMRSAALVVGDREKVNVSAGQGQSSASVARGVGSVTYNNTFNELSTPRATALQVLRIQEEG